MTYSPRIYSRILKTYVDVEEGNWENGEFISSTLPAPQKQTISILSGTPATIGKLTLPFDQVYEGELVNGVPHGRGKITTLKGHTKGLVFEGEFVNGVKHGMGKTIYPRSKKKTFGKEQTSRWENGEIVK
jgi:hypothetical protein